MMTTGSIGNRRAPRGRWSRPTRFALAILAAGVASTGGAGTVSHAAPGSPGAPLNPTLKATIPTPYVLNGGHPTSYGWGVATMPDGQSVIVGDIFNNRVVRYDLSGNPFPSTSSGVVLKTGGRVGANPYGLAVDPNDWTIYLGSAQCCGIQVWTTSDHVAYTFKKIIDPTGGPHSSTSRYPARMVVGNDGTLYVSDMTLNAISAFSSQAAGNHPLYQFGAFGSGTLQFNNPRGIALDGSTPQRLYVVDANNNRVQVFDTSQMSNPSTRGFLYSFGSRGGAQSQFGGNLRGGTYDRINNRFYIVDIGKNHVEEWQIDPAATSAAQDSWVQNIGTPQPGLSTMTTCCALPGYFSDGGREATVDGNGNLWVGDMPNFRVQVFYGPSATNPGTFAFAAPPATDATWQPPTGKFSYPEGVGVEADGTSIVSDSHNFRLEWFDTPANNYAFTKQEGSRGRFNDYAFAYARNISVNVNPSSSAFSQFALADTYNNSVHVFQESGAAVCMYGGNGSGGPDAVTAGAGLQTRTGLNSNLALPSGVAVDNSSGPNEGDIYIADSGNKRVVVLDSACTLLGTITNATMAGINFQDPRGLGVDPSNGDLYVTDFAARSMVHFTVSGSWAAKTQVLTVSQITGNMSRPFDVVVDPGNPYLYVSDESLGAILIFSTTTRSFVSSFTIKGQPEGISMAPNGHLYIASRSNDKVLDYCVTNC